MRWLPEAGRAYRDGADTKLTVFPGGHGSRSGPPVAVRIPDEARLGSIK